MPSKTIETQIKHLRGLRAGASERVRDIIQEIIDLYSDRKISNITTAKNLINDLKSDNARKVSSHLPLSDLKRRHPNGEAMLNLVKG